MKNPFLIALCALLIGGCRVSTDRIVTDYGAVADGITNNVAAIQQAIDDASAAGGGKVVIPPGNFMTGPVYLKSGVELHLELGACLTGPTDRSAYPASKVRTALITAIDQHDISITGRGVIDGRGQELVADIIQKLRKGELTPNDTLWRVKRPGNRTLIINLVSCRNINISDITLKDASDWVQNYAECDGLTIRGITVQSTAYWNNDGLDVTDCRNVRIVNCFINSADDAICLKSENPESCCENIFIDSCTVRSSANGFKLGTASHGGFKNIKVRNLTVFDTYRSAIAIEAVDGGAVENIDVRNVVARNTGNAIFIRRGNRTGKIGLLKNVYIADVKAEVPLYKPDQGYPIEGPPDHLNPGFDKMPVRPSHFHIYGHPWLPYNPIPASVVGIPGNPVEDVTIENVEITYPGRGNKEIACIPLDKLASVPENEARYPEFSMFGELPAWGLYVRHAEGLILKNISVAAETRDYRPAFVFDDVSGLSMSGIKIAEDDSGPQIILKDVKNDDVKVASELVKKIN